MRDWVALGAHAQEPSSCEPDTPIKPRRRVPAPPPGYEVREPGALGLRVDLDGFGGAEDNLLGSPAGHLRGPFVFSFIFHHNDPPSPGCLYAQVFRCGSLQDQLSSPLPSSSRI